MHEMRNEDRLWQLEYQASVAMRYHSRRQAFLDSVARGEPMLALLVGSSAFAAATVKDSELTQALTLLTVALSAFALAFRPGDKARVHEDLFRRWAAFRGELVRIEAADELAIRDAEVAALEIGGVTPHQLQALTILCMNEENEFRRSPERYRMGGVQKALAQYVTLPFQNFRGQPAQ